MKFKQVLRQAWRDITHWLVVFLVFISSLTLAITEREGFLILVFIFLNAIIPFMLLFILSFIVRFVINLFNPRSRKEEKYY